MEGNNAPPPGAVDDRQAQITDYLQAPRKKRKNYVILAIPEGFSDEIINRIVSFTRKNFPGLAISHPENKKELQRQLGRNISLLVLDDEFCPNDEVFELVKNLKEKRSDEVIPVLFLTKNPSKLVQSYHKVLLPYQETDDYVDYRKDSYQRLTSKLKTGINQEAKRKSRRFPLNHNINFFHLDRNETLEGKLVDISVHGAKIVATGDLLFSEGDQLKLSIPTNVGAPEANEYGDFLKLSARVRRVFIGGNHAGICFAYVSDVQNARLTKFIVAVASRKMDQSTRALKAKAAAAAKSTN